MGKATETPDKIFKGFGATAAKAEEPAKAKPARKRAEPGALENGYFRSRDWMAAVASIGTCVLCGTHGVQVAHRNEGKAKGRKMDDSLTAAICPKCHTEIDQGKAMTREERRATMDKAIVLTLQALTRGGLVGVVL